jgi:hypothetical protein
VVALDTVGGTVRPPRVKRSLESLNGELILTAQTVQLGVADLQQRVQDVYRQVAREPHRSYHFEVGRALAERAST